MMCRGIFYTPLNVTSCPSSCPLCRFVCAVGQAHSFASFGLCVGLCGLQMCVTAALAFS